MIICAVVMLALLAFTYVGYPATIGALARLAPVKTGKVPAAAGDVTAATAPLVSICLPVCDGAGFLAAKVDSLLAQDYPADRIEILIYCDGCRDDSEAIARALAAEPRAGGRIRVIVAAERLGKPTGINALAAAARGELLLFNDVRQLLSPGATRALAAALVDAAVGCATGELVLAGGAGSGVYWKYERWIRSQESRFRGVVGMTGAIAMMRRAEFAPLPEGTILDDVLMPMRLVLAGKRVALVGDAQAFDAAFDDDREFRRKVRTLTGNYQLFAMMPALLLPWRNPIWFETFSHKILRLLAPWFMVVLLLVSLAATADGQGGVWPLLLGAQIGFYVASAAGRRVGAIGGLARTFVVLNAAAVVGLWRFVRRRQRVTW